VCEDLKKYNMLSDDVMLSHNIMSSDNIVLSEHIMLSEYPLDNILYYYQKTWNILSENILIDNMLLSDNML
jgi:hypothetical protein